MPAHGDCKFCNEWLVQDKYKEWVVKDGDLRLARCKLKFCMKSSINPSMNLKKCQLPDDGAFEKVKVGIGTCACVIHML